MELIISHTNADFDSLAAMAAAKKIYPKAVLAFSGSAESPVRDFLTLHGDWLEVLSAGDVSLDEVKRLIIVDTRESMRLGPFRDLVERPGVEIHLYDHHPTSYRDIVGEVNVIKQVGSTTTLLVDLIREKNLLVSAEEATLFMTGIYVDTGSLSFPTTTVLDIDCAAWLLEKGANLKMVGDTLNRSLSPEQRNLLNLLIQSSGYTEVHGHRILLSRASLDEYVDELALLTHRLIDLEHASAAFSTVRMGDRVYVVGRSAHPLINAGDVLTDLGGGGHATAASACLKDATVDEAEKLLVRALERRVRPELCARDIMQAPVWSIGPKQTVKKAHQDMIRYGYGSYLVMENGAVLGMLSRRDVDKALHHGFGHAPVDAYMSRRVISAGLSTPVSEIRKLMIEHGVGRIPIVEKGEVAGVVTRREILQSMAGPVFPRPILASTLRIEDWSAVPEFVVQLLKKAGEAGDRRRQNVFVVGGFVRDLLLGVGNLDIDLVAEGDGISYANALAEVLGGRVVSFEKFGTAMVVLPKEFKIDVASAREEFYARPAALPEVAGTSIKRDLYRRDFSVNAMAVKLNLSDFGQLIDFFGGQRDLQHGVIRVLHNLSFVDDPTRIFRAVRFEQRYHFRMDSQTEKLLRRAVKSGAVECLSMERVSGELTLILAEVNPLPAILRMKSLRMLPLIHPALRLGNKTIAALEEIPQVLRQFKDLLQNSAIAPWLAYGIGLLSELKAAEAAEVMAKLRWPVRDREKFSFFLQEWDLIFTKLGQARPLLPSEIVSELENVSLEGVLFLYACARSSRMRERIREYLINLRNVKPFLTGDDLAGLGLKPGPAYRKILDKIRKAQLDGTVQSKEEARELLKKEAVFR